MAQQREHTNIIIPHLGDQRGETSTARMGCQRLYQSGTDTASLPASFDRQRNLGHIGRRDTPG